MGTKKNKKLVLEKNTTKNLKVNSDIKAGATQINCGGYSRINCQGITITGTPTFSCSVTLGTLQPTLDC